MSRMLEVGAVAPDFSLPDQDGTVVTLTSFAGRKLVLYFYPKDDTSGCTAEALAFNALRGNFEAAGASILGVSPDGPRSHAKFRAKHDLAFPLLADETRLVLDAYGVWTEKSMYGRKYMGVERTTLLIAADGRVARIWTKVKVPGHAADVLAAVEAL